MSSSDGATNEGQAIKKHHTTVWSLFLGKGNSPVLVRPSDCCFDSVVNFSNHNYPAFGNAAPQGITLTVSGFSNQWQQFPLSFLTDHRGLQGC